MSLISSLYIGTSGLAANSDELNVVGDNIANSNTVGFKAGRAAFEAAFSETLIGGVGQMGNGTRLQAVQRMFSQGAPLQTGQATDLMLQGPGFFVVKGEHNGVPGQFYTRAGQFRMDESGHLVNLEGLRVQGYTAATDGSVSGPLGDLNLGAVNSPAKSTGSITLKGNLSSDAPVMTTPFDPANPDATSNFSSSVTVYDSLGKAHQMDVYYSHTGPGTWEFHAVTDVAGVPTDVATGSLSFDSDGKLTDATTGPFTFSPPDATPQDITFNFGDSTVNGGTGLGGFTQFANASATTFTNQDGFEAGVLSRIDVDSQGNVVGMFTNGQSRTVAQVAVADFEAPDKLSSVGGNLWAERPESGQPTVGAGGEGGRGAVVAGALEQSNVDISSEFVRMISAQRGFQANSKTISTADQLLQELISLKR